MTVITIGAMSVEDTHTLASGSYTIAQQVNADDAFPLTEFMMKPFPSKALTDSEFLTNKYEFLLLVCI